MLDDVDSEVRANICFAFGNVPELGRTVLPELLNRLKSPRNPSDRFWLPGLISRIPDSVETALPILLDLVHKDPVSSFTIQYLAAIARYGPSAREAESRLLEILHSLVSQPNTSPDATLISAYIETLGRIETKSVGFRRILMRLLQSDDETISLAAAAAVCGFESKNKSAMKVLLSGFNSQQLSIRRDAILTIRELATRVDFPIPAISAGLDDPDELIRQLTAETLKRLSDR
jgi:HEAT repeat protein